MGKDWVRQRQTPPQGSAFQGAYHRKIRFQRCCREGKARLRQAIVQAEPRRNRVFFCGGVKLRQRDELCDFLWLFPDRLPDHCIPDPEVSITREAVKRKAHHGLCLPKRARPVVVFDIRALRIQPDERNRYSCFDELALANIVSEKQSHLR
ncbi:MULTISPECIES: hypothetical protein [unclassified Rhizobium]|uniref:hypothetical protein n=1 Tax=unclassified Rhizobium TaxID=2613769 RepID=UPI001AEB998E|nr:MULTISPECIES: hypothetical protein [unclassified Rhizobium]MBP2459423.1 hypothetical protein [Rhizobium sp. PvP014]